MRRFAAQPGMPARDIEVMREFTKNVPLPHLVGPGYAVARVGFSYLVGNADPYFTTRAEVYASPMAADRGDSECRIPAGEVDPRLANVDRWHLWGMDSGGMHYRANAIFWADVLTFRRAATQPADHDAVKHFQSTVVWGALPGDEGEPWMLPLPDLCDWLDARLPRLMSKFREDVEAALPGLWAEMERAMRAAAVQP